MTPDAAINVSVSNHYKEADYGSEVTSQGLLGEEVEIMESGPLFSLIRQADDYTSWISSDQLTELRTNAAPTLPVTSHFLKILREPSAGADAIRDAVIGCRLTITGEKGDWHSIRLPDGETGWAEKRHFGTFPTSTPDNILQLARQFLGYQYTWGGRSPKGFDCSGLVQTVFGLLGTRLPRDSWQQQQEHIISTDYRDAEPGDLLFFARTPKRVTHVAISTGEGRFIHASGWVKYNSLMESSADYSEHHVNTFVSVNRYPISGKTS